MIKIERCNKINKDFQKLIELLDTDLNSRYGILQSQYNKFNKIVSIDKIVIAYQADDPVGCGCYKKFDDKTIEIKRMFVKQENRGKGISKMILAELEKWAIENEFQRSILETGIKQHEAIGLYYKSGYVKMDNYVQYIGNTNSVCMSKDLKY